MSRGTPNVFIIESPQPCVRHTHTPASCIQPPLLPLLLLLFLLPLPAPAAAEATNATFAGYASIAQGPAWLPASTTPSSTQPTADRDHLQLVPFTYRPALDPVDGSLGEDGAATAEAAVQAAFLRGRTGSSVTVKLQLGGGTDGPSATATFAPALFPAVSHEAQLLTPDIYPDTNVIRVAVQQRDAAGITRTQGGMLRARVVPSAALRAIFDAEPEASCSPGAASGACIASVTLPTAWLKDRADLPLNGPLADGGNVSVLAGRAAGSLATVGTAKLWAQPSVSLSAVQGGLPVGALVATLPLQLLTAGQTFDIPVVGVASLSIATFRLRVVVAPELELLSFVVDTAKWTGDDTITEGRSGTASFFLSDPGAAETGDQSLVQQPLLRVRMRVRAGTAIGLDNVVLQPNVTFEALFLSDIDEREYINSVEGVFLISSDGVLPGGAGAGSMAALTVVDSARPLGMVAYADNAELLNLALLNGQRVATPVHILIATTGSPASFSAITNGGGSGRFSLGCASTAPAALKAQSSCEEAYVDGTELDGSSEARVVASLRYGSPPPTAAEAAARFTATVRLVVWRPQLPLIFQLSQPTVRRVANWLQDSVPSAAACSTSLRYQRAALRVVTRFDTVVPFISGGVGPYLDVTSVVASRLDVLGGIDGGRAVLLPTAGEGGRPVVEGLAPGTVKVRYVRVGDELGDANAAVAGTVDLIIDGTAAPVAVTSLEAALVSSVSLAPPSGPVPRDGTATLVATVGRATLDFEGAVARVIAAALFADGTRMALPLADATEAAAFGLRLTSLHPSTVTVAANTPSGTTDSLAVAVGAEGAEGALATVSWTAGATNGVCGLLNVGTGDVRGRVLLPDAREARLTLSQSRMAPPGNAAATAGLPVEANVAVVLVFPDGREVAATLDNRTVYDMSGAADRFELITTDTSVRLRALAGAAPGDGILRVSFTHENVTAQATAAVAVASALQPSVHPLPAYTGSASVAVTELRPIAGTSPQAYQEAALAATLLLSDGTSIALTSRAGLQAAVSSGGLAVIRNAPGNAWRITIATPAAGASSEASQLSITFAPFPSPATLTVDVSPEAARVSSLTALRMDAGGTLFGLADAASSRLRLGAVFDDGTRYDSLLTGSNGLALPGLVSFSSADTAATTVGVSNGIATLRGNAPLAVRLTATVGADATVSGTAVTAALDIACNLDPVVGDVDLGSRTGAPLAPAEVNDVFTVGVFAHSGGRDIGSYEFRVSFDSAALRVEDVVASHAGIFDRNIQNSQGAVNFGGAVAAGDGRGSRKQLATLTVRALQAGIHSVAGQVITLAEANIDGTPIGDSGPRPFIAGSVSVSVSEADRRRRRAAQGQGQDAGVVLRAAVPGYVRRRYRRASDGCDVGDLNGNCVFDVTDVPIVSTYLVQLAEGFVSSQGQALLALHSSQPHTEANLDADRSSVVNERDGTFLNKAALLLLSFVEDIGIDTATGEAGCEASLSFRLLQRGNVPVSASTTRMYAIVQNGASAAADEAEEAFAEADAVGRIANGRLVGSARVSPASGGPVEAYGAVVEIFISNSTAGLWKVSFPVYRSLSTLGITLVQVVPGSSNPEDAEYRFFSGPETAYRFGGQLRLSLDDTTGGTVLVQSNSPVGYNPLVTADFTETVSECLTRQGLCLDTNACLSTEYLDGECDFGESPACTACASCSATEVEAAPCTATSDTVCLPEEPLTSSPAASSFAGSPATGPTASATTTAPNATGPAAMSTNGSGGNVSTFPPISTLPFTTTTANLTLVAASSKSDDATASIVAGAVGGIIFLLLLLLLLLLLVRRRRHQRDKVAPSTYVTETSHEYGFASTFGGAAGMRFAGARNEPFPVFCDQGTLDPQTLFVQEKRDLAPVLAAFPAIGGLRPAKSQRETAVELLPESEAYASKTAEGTAVALPPDVTGLALRYYAALGDGDVVLDITHTWSGVLSGQDALAELPPLHVAAMFGQSEAMSELLNQGAYILQASNMSQTTVLHAACAAASVPCVERLLDAHAPIQASDRYAFEPIHVAAATSAAIVELLLAAGASPDVNRDVMATPLMVAAANDNVAAARVLLGAGAAADARDQDGLTALHHCCRGRGSAEMVTLLLDAGAQPDAPDSQAATPEDLARNASNQAALAALLSRPAAARVSDVTATHVHGAAPLEPQQSIEIEEAESLPTLEPYLAPPVYHEDSSEDEAEEDGSPSEVVVPMAMPEGTDNVYGRPIMHDMAHDDHSDDGSDAFMDLDEAAENVAGYVDEGPDYRLRSEEDVDAAGYPSDMPMVRPPETQYDNATHLYTGESDPEEAEHAVMTAEADAAVGLLAALHDKTPDAKARVGARGQRPSIVTVVLQKPVGESAGFAAAGGTETGLGGILVTAVDEDGAAQGQLYVDDEILAIGTTRMRQLSSSEAKDLLTDTLAYPEVHMVISRPHKTVERLEQRGLKEAGRGRFVLDKPLRKRRSIGLVDAMAEAILEQNPYGLTLPEEEF